MALPTGFNDTSGGEVSGIEDRLDQSRLGRRQAGGCDMVGAGPMAALAGDARAHGGEDRPRLHSRSVTAKAPCDG